MLDEALRDDLRHDRARAVRPLAPIETQGERKRLGEIVRRSGREAFVGVGHGATIAER